MACQARRYPEEKPQAYAIYVFATDCDCGIGCRNKRFHSHRFFFSFLQPKCCKHSILSITKHSINPTATMSTGAQPLDLTYTRYMKNHPYGTALYTPLPFRIFHPGSCGYFDAHGSWNPIVDLSDPSLLSSHGFSAVPEELHRAPPESVFQWGPKISENTNAQKVSFNAGISAGLAAALPVGIGTWYKFSSSRRIGLGFIVCDYCRA